jgi:murein DD-endopeptidase MepM/ murein hydrolase activator NlpD
VPRHRSAGHRAPTRCFGAALLAGALVSSVVGGATLLRPDAAVAQESLREARAAREEARRQAAAAAAQVNLLRAEDRELASVLSQLDEALASHMVLVSEARLALAAAEEDALRRTADLRAALDELAARRAEIRRLAVDEFVGRSGDPLLGLLVDADVNRGVRRAALFDEIAGDRTDLIDRLRALEVDADLAAAEAASAREEAAALRDRLEADLAAIEAQRADQRRIHGELQSRRERWEAAQAEFEAEEEAMTSLVQELQARLLAAASPNLSATSRRGFIQPTAGRIGSGFGPRVHPIFGYRRMHNGVDIGAPTGQAIVAAKSGTVLFAGARGGYGNVVLIEHEGGVVTLYAHQSQILVAEGERVDRGEVVGRIGSTGVSTGPHLHFEVRVGGAPQDPLLFLPG